MLTTFVLMLAGLALISRGESGFANTASAQVGSHLQIAPASAPGAWSDSTGPAWGFDPGAPGVRTSGYVLLRSVDVTHPSTTGLTMKTVIDSDATPGFADQVIVTSMQLGDTDLLSRWSPCVAGGVLTLAGMASCSPLPGLTTPPGGDGAAFSMTFEFSQAAGNVFQGASLGARFLFTLTDTTANPPPDVHVATPTPTGSGIGTPLFTPSPTVSPTPTHTPPAVSSSRSPSATSGTDVLAEGTPGAGVKDIKTPRASVTPIAPFTGTGSNSGGDLGMALFIAGGALLAAWLMTMFVLAGKKRREADR
jgi:hypothetical protein